VKGHVPGHQNRGRLTRGIHVRVVEVVANAQPDPRGEFLAGAHHPTEFPQVAARGDGIGGPEPTILDCCPKSLRRRALNCPSEELPSRCDCQPDGKAREVPRGRGRSARDDLNLTELDNAVLIWSFQTRTFLVAGVPG